MIQVREFLTDACNIESAINAWLRENQDIEVVDIKYSISAYSGDAINDVAGVYNGALIIYKIK